MSDYIIDFHAVTYVYESEINSANCFLKVNSMTVRSTAPK